MTYRDGSLLSNGGAVYVISDGQRLPIESANTFLQKYEVLWFLRAIIKCLVETWAL
jgi:hypothetical protein